MIPIESTVHHQLGQQAAMQRIHHMAASLAQLFPQQVHQIEWHQQDHRIDVQFAAYGYVVAWEADVQESAVYLHGRIPDAAKPYRNKILQVITARVEETLAPFASDQTAARAA